MKNGQNHREAGDFVNVSAYTSRGAGFPNTPAGVFSGFPVPAGRVLQSCPPTVEGRTGHRHRRQVEVFMPTTPSAVRGGILKRIECHPLRLGGHRGGRGRTPGS